MLSASVFQDDRRSVLETGGNQFIAKPFRESQIWEALELHLGLKLVRAGEKPAVQAAPAGVTRAEVALLDAETLASHRDAVECGYPQRIPALLAPVAGKHPRVVEALSKLAKDLEIRKLVDLL